MQKDSQGSTWGRRIRFLGRYDAHRGRYGRPKSRFCDCRSAAHGCLGTLKFCVRVRNSVTNKHVFNGWRASANRSTAIAPQPRVGAGCGTGRRSRDSDLAHESKVVCHRLLHEFPQFWPNRATRWRRRAGQSCVSWKLAKIGPFCASGAPQSRDTGSTHE